MWIQTSISRHGKLHILVSLAAVLLGQSQNGCMYFRHPNYHPSPNLVTCSQLTPWLHSQMARLCEARGVPKLLRPFLEALAVLPADVPLPMSLLSRLWSTNVSDAQAAAQALGDLACMRLATLQDGSVWALLPSPVVDEIQVWKIVVSSC